MTVARKLLLLAGYGVVAWALMLSGSAGIEVPADGSYYVTQNGQNTSSVVRVAQFDGQLEGLDLNNLQLDDLEGRPILEKYIPFDPEGILRDFGGNLSCVTSVCTGTTASPVGAPMSSGSGISASNRVGTMTAAGGDTGPFSFPYVVALTNRYKDVQCTGTVMGSRTVLTAAHCACDGNLERVFLGTSVYEEDRDSLGYEAWFDLEPSETAFFDPYFCSEENSLDLAVVYLRPGQSFAKEHVAWFPAYEVGGTPEGTGTIVGFGETETNDAGGVKTHADITYRICDPSSGVDCNGEGEFVSVQEDGEYQDTCNGDSGGPLLYSFWGGWALVGVTSRDIYPDDHAECGEGGIYGALSIHMIEGERAVRWLMSAIQ